MDSEHATAIIEQLGTIEARLRDVADLLESTIETLHDGNQIARIGLLRTLLNDYFLVPINGGGANKTRAQATQLLTFEIQDLVRRGHEINALGPVPGKES